MAAGRLSSRVQLDQLGGDLADCPASPALTLGPVGTAQPVQARVFSADVAGYLIKGIHRDIEPVPWLAAPGWRVFDHQVLAGRASHRTLHHLDIAPHPVLAVHHGISRGELERVDLILAARWQPPASPVRGPLAGEISCCEDREPDLIGHETVT